MSGFNSKRDMANDKDALFQKFEVEQPAQEPVKCAVRDCQNHMHQGQFVGSVCLPCYITPPQRPWLGLTDEDWKEIEDMPDTFDQGVAWAQAKLKEKNNG